MLITLAINNYRSLLDLVLPLGQLNVITGANGSGKSNLYRALRLLSDSPQYGLLRPLSSAELSDGTLRYLLWVAALLTPRPPLMMVKRARIFRES